MKAIPIRKYQNCSNISNKVRICRQTSISNSSLKSILIPQSHHNNKLNNIARNSNNAATLAPLWCFQERSAASNKTKPVPLTKHSCTQKIQMSLQNLLIKLVKAIKIDANSLKFPKPQDHCALLHSQQRGEIACRIMAFNIAYLSKIQSTNHLQLIIVTTWQKKSLLPKSPSTLSLSQNRP